MGGSSKIFWEKKVQYDRALGKLQKGKASGKIQKDKASG
jgi:hypothetical protein